MRDLLLPQSNGIPPPAEANGADEVKPETANGEEKVESKDEQGATIVPEDVSETKPEYGVTEVQDIPSKCTAFRTPRV
ncbi:hypothetical protein PG991_003079 [Apiospora marii]|uniref:Uncharacterized protein n=1 Tax=Apiospora marii TaxID=335849 RepID=A0ABR1SIG4_9PEZI